jgi:ABC-2 type transport system ATP-binding protein
MPDDGAGPSLSLENVTTDQVGDIAAANGIGLHELSGKTASLEEVFMSMTAGAVEYHGNDSMAFPGQQQQFPTQYSPNQYASNQYPEQAGQYAPPPPGWAPQPGPPAQGGQQEWNQPGGKA